MGLRYESAAVDFWTDVVAKASAAETALTADLRLTLLPSLTDEALTVPAAHIHSEMSARHLVPNLLASG